LKIEGRSPYQVSFQRNFPDFPSQTRLCANSL
jgi:hypothetical protein